MVLIVLVLVFSNIKSLAAHEILANNPFYLIESSHLIRVKRNDMLKQKFPEQELPPCKEMYQTNEAPFTAIVLYKSSGRLLCMGSIIDTRHILTAKRCYEKVETKDLKVLLGYYKAYWGEHAQVLDVKKIVRHETELAILRLVAPMQTSEFVQPVKLPPYSILFDTIEKVFPGPYKLIGFPVDRFNIPGELIDKKLMYRLKENSIVVFDECKKNYTKLTTDAKKMFCTLGNATFCWGGYGAPVLIWMTDFFLQVGVVVADNCTTNTMGPFLSVRTDVFGEWIRGNSFHGHQPS